MLTYFAAPRLATLQSFFKTKSDTDLLGCYAWNQAVAGGLFPVLGDFEVALRNALHVALSRYYGGVDSYNWMLPRANPAHTLNPAAPETLPSHHTLPTKTRNELAGLASQIQGKKGPSYIVTPDDIVAGLQFGFWEQLIKSLSHGSHPTGLQTAILSVVFPFAPTTAAVPYGHADFRMRTATLLKRIRDVRNRVGHHDALWAIPEFDGYGNLGFVPRRPRHTVVSLNKFCARLCEFASWIDPAVRKHIHDSDHWNSLQVLLSRDALAAYRYRGGKSGTYQALVQSMPGRVSLRVRNWPRHTGTIHGRIVFREFHY